MEAAGARGSSALVESAAVLHVLQDLRRSSSEPGLVKHNQALSALARQSRWQPAIELLQSMRSKVLRLSDYSLGPAVNALGSTAKWQDAISLLMQEWFQRGLQPNSVIVGAAAAGCERAREWLRALLLLDATSHVANTVAWNSGISTCDKAGQWPWAIWLLLRGLPQHSLKPTVISLTAALSACQKAGELEIAEGLLRGASSQNIQVDIMAYNSLVSSCEKSQRLQNDKLQQEGTEAYPSASGTSSSSRPTWERAIQIYAELLIAGLLPSVVTCTALASSCGQAAQWQLATLSLAQLRKRWGLKHNAVSYGAQITAFERGQQWEWAFDSLAASLTAGVADEVSFGAAASSASHEGRWELAFGLVQHVRRARLAVTAIMRNAMITVCSRGQQWQQALQLLFDERLAGQGRGGRDVAGCTAAIAACEGGLQWSWALALLQAMQPAGLRPDGRTASGAVGACAKSGSWQHALGVLWTFLSWRIPLDSVLCSGAVTALEAGGKWEEALHLARYAQDSAVALSMILYSGLIRVCRLCSTWQWTLHLTRTSSTGLSEFDEAVYSATASSLRASGEALTLLPLLRELRTAALERCRVASGEECHVSQASRRELRRGQSKQAGV